MLNSYHYIKLAFHFDSQQTKEETTISIWMKRVMVTAAACNLLASISVECSVLCGNDNDALNRLLIYDLFLAIQALERRVSLLTTPMA